jgi:hypothetical protein
MTARHPITGKPIRILRTEASISRDKKTLVYLTGDADKSARWNRWQTIVSDREGLAVLEETMVVPNHVILWNRLSDEEIVFWKGWLTIHAKEVHIVILSQTIANQLGSDILEKINVLCYNEMFDLYPFIETPLTDDSSLLQIIYATATIFRYNEVYHSKSNYGTRDKEVLKAIKCYESHGGKINSTLLEASIVPKFVLIQQYFEHSLSRRAREIKECLLRNIKNPYIDEIHLLNEKAFQPTNDWLKHPKVRETVIVNRISYDAVFNHIKSNVGPNTIVAFSNSDIYFGSEIRHLYSISLSKRFLSLLRWDDHNMPQIQPGSVDWQESKIFGPRPDSQDTWIVLSDDVTFNPNIDDFQIPFGKPGCDNAINVAMLKQKFLVCNPAYTIKTYHMHLSATRNYNPQDIVEKPIYLYIDPTIIQEYQQVKDLQPWLKIPQSSKQTATVFRQIKYVNENSAKTICTMLRREKKWFYNVDEKNDFVYETDFVPNTYNLESKFTSPNGLVYGMNQIFIDKNEQWLKKWETANINILATTLHVPNLLAMEFTEEMNRNISLWCTQYLAPALRIRNQIYAKSGEKPEFLVCQRDSFPEFLSSLAWQPAGEKVRFVPYDEKLQYYADSLWVVEPRQTEARIQPDDIATLRQLIPSYLKTEQKEKSTVIFAMEGDEDILSKSWFERIQLTTFKGWRVNRIGSKTTAKEIMQVLAGADVLIGQSDSEWSPLSWMWCLPEKATVIEVMRDTKPKGENIHLAAVSGLQYLLIVAKREPLDIQRENVLLDINIGIKNYCFDVAMKTDIKQKDRPTIIMPTDQTGIHEHSGDTFREMVDIWAERGYIQLEKSASTPFVWLNRIGSVLLYDRPTHMWFPPDLLYDFGLFGNCTPPLNKANKSSVWSFWPRSPRKIEEFSARPLLKWEDRQYKSIFLGKVENGIQMRMRSKSDWQAVIEKWSMPVDSTGMPYAYTQEEYLQEVSNSRFGLALAGYGNKCNREIEYFALGTVPVCSPEVDLQYYLNPPKEGVHFLRVKSAEEIKPLIDSITEEKWNKMSQAGFTWWKENASAEGMFRLTMATVNKHTR